MSLVFTKCHPDAKIPDIATPGSVGYDLCTTDEGVVPCGERLMISTGLRVAIPFDHYGRIAPRSGLALRNGIDVMAGVIDPDYRGELKVILYNTDKSNEFRFAKGTRIAQMIIERCATPSVREVGPDSFDAISTERGASGFGSTGYH